MIITHITTVEIHCELVPWRGTAMAKRTQDEDEGNGEDEGEGGEEDEEEKEKEKLKRAGPSQSRDFAQR